MDAEIQKALDNGQLTSSQAEVLDQLEPGSHCLHKSWGFGTITDRNLLLNQIVIDFIGKKGHPMQADYAAQSLRPIPDEHVLARVHTAPDEVRTQAREDPIGLMRQILESYDGSATQEKISGTLVGTVFKDADFRKWWSNTKRALKKDGHFNVPAKRSEPVSLREDAISRADELLEQFRQSSQLKTKTAVLNEITKSLGVFDNPSGQLQPLVHELEKDAATNQRLHPAETVEFILARDEITGHFKEVEAGEGTLDIGTFLTRLGPQLLNVLEQLPAAKQRGLINGLQDAFGENWQEVALQFMHEGSARVVTEAARCLVEHGHEQMVRDALAKWIRERSISSETLLWLCRERKKNFGDLIEPGLLNAIVASLERDQFNEKRTSRLQDLMLDDKELIGDIMADTDPESAREAMRRLMLTPVFEELSKRSILARIIKLHPTLQSMLSGGDEEEKTSLIVSWKSLRERKEELEELVNKRIPENSEEIRIAREYGDLRENFEYKAAKEMQGVLMRRKAELEQDLGRARGSDFANPDTSQVSMGTKVRIRDTKSGEILEYSLLGAWDSIPERHILSYMTTIGQELLGKRPGEYATLPTDEGGAKQVEILAIEAFEGTEEFAG